MPTSIALSQALLVLWGAIRLIASAPLDSAVLLILAGLLFMQLLHLARAGTWAIVFTLAFMVLMGFVPALCAMAPAVVYAALLKAPWPLVSASLLISLAFSGNAPTWATVLSFLAAALLAMKDQALKALYKANLTVQDEATFATLRQREEYLSLQQAQEDRRRLAVAEERNRIARDIHDNVGHLISRSILQVAALRVTAKDDRQKAALDTLKASLDQAMTATRKSVHNTRQDTLHLDQEIAALIRAFTFCPVDYVNKSAGTLSLNQKYVLMAIIQEALSNVMRHSDATKVTITLSDLGQKHLLLIADNGTGQGPVTGGGMGLAAMEERLRGLGGSLHLSRDKGFRLLVTLPHVDGA